MLSPPRICCLYCPLQLCGRRYVYVYVYVCIICLCVSLSHALTLTRIFLPLTPLLFLQVLPAMLPLLNSLHQAWGIDFRSTLPSHWAALYAPTYDAMKQYVRVMCYVLCLYVYVFVFATSAFALCSPFLPHYLYIYMYI